jgi:hypothetical protein
MQPELYEAFFSGFWMAIASFWDAFLLNPGPWLLVAGLFIGLAYLSAKVRRR